MSIPQSLQQKQHSFLEAAFHQQSVENLSQSWLN